MGILTCRKCKTDHHGESHGIRKRSDRNRYERNQSAETFKGKQQNINFTGLIRVGEEIVIKLPNRIWRYCRRRNRHKREKAIWMTERKGLCEDTKVFNSQKRYAEQQW